LTPLARIIAFTDEVQVTQPHETRFSMAVAGAECNTVIELTQEHHIA
jgi:hypothetical protein